LIAEATASRTKRYKQTATTKPPQNSYMFVPSLRGSSRLLVVNQNSIEKSQPKSKALPEPPLE
jgi:hypothetical protein